MRALVRSASMSTKMSPAKAFAASVLVVSLAVTGCSSSDETPSSTSSASSVIETSVSDSAVGTTVDTASSVSESPSAATTSAAGTTSAPAVAPDTSEIAPPPTTEVPAAGGGDINETVAPVSLTTAPSVALTETAQFGGGVTADLTSITRQDIAAQGPGEISGPGLVVTIKITNRSSAPINLDAVNVTLDDGNATPASPMSGDPFNPFSGDLAVGAETSAVYVFALPTDYKNPSNFTVSYSTDAAVLVFSGNAP